MNSQNKKKIISVIITVIFISLMFFIGLKVAPVKVINTDNTLKVTGFLGNDGTILNNFFIPPADIKVEVAPWLNNSTDNTDQKPVTPDILELDKTYKNIMRAYYTRDWNLFTKNASSYLQWVFETNSEFSQITSEDVSVAIKSDISGEQYFKLLSPERLLFQIPTDVSLLQPLSGDFLIKDPRSDFYLLDKDEKNAVMIKDKPNMYYFLVNYINKDNRFTCAQDGRILFVFEDSEWKFNAQDWICENVPNTNFVDGKEEGIVTEIDMANVASNIIPTITIPKNSGIKWSNLSGILFSTNTQDNWQSPYLNNSNFIKYFASNGEIDYIINSTSKKITGKIIVQ